MRVAFLSLLPGLAALALAARAPHSQQKAPASRPAASVESRPFGAQPVVQPRLAATPVFGIEEGQRAGVRDERGVRVVGALHVVGQRGLEVVHASSRDGGKTFGRATVLMTVRSGAGARRGPRIAALGDRVVVTAPEGGAPEQRRILCVSSSDGGATWSKAVAITDRAGAAAEGLHELAFTTKGDLVSVWLDARKGKGPTIMASRSTDGGLTWIPNQGLCASPSGSVCDCCPVAMAAGPEGRVMIVFCNSLEGARDLWGMESSDGGATFGEARRMQGDRWRIAACPMAVGAVAYWDDFGSFDRRPLAINNREGDLLEMLSTGLCPTAVRALRAGAEGTRYDSPHLGLGPDGAPWVVFEAKKGRAVETRLLRLARP